MALGINTVAAAMKQAGAMQVGVGPHAIVETLPTVGVIVASLNMVLPGAMLGEVTPDIVHAILETRARATKVLLPLNRARVEIVGAGTGTLDALIAQSLSRVRSLTGEAPPLFPSHRSCRTTRVCAGR